MIDQVGDLIKKSIEAREKTGSTDWKPAIIMLTDLVLQTVERVKEARLESELKARQEAEAMEAAKHLEAQGETEAANEVMQQAIDTTPTVVLPKIQSKIEGISTRKVFKFKITDIKKIKPDFLMPDEKKIGAMVRATGKAAEGLIGGIAVYEDIITASRC